MTAALISIIVVAAGLVGLSTYLAAQLVSSHRNAEKAYEAGNALVKSNFELQTELTKWKSSYDDSVREIVAKSQELDRAIAARQLLEKRQADLVLRLAEGAPLDTLTESLQSDLDKVKEMSRPPVPPEISPTLSAPLKLPLPAPPVARVTPVEKSKGTK